MTILLTAAATLAGLLGAWRGQSLCTVKPSSCNDEQVVYHIARGPRPDMVSIDACKLVDGKEVSMGVLDCTVDATATAVTCPIPKGVFKFQVAGAKMQGTLTLTDGTLFRRISVAHD